jgi:hypothetical protein
MLAVAKPWPRKVRAALIRISLAFWVRFAVPGSDVVDFGFRVSSNDPLVDVPMIAQAEPGLTASVRQLSIPYTIILPIVQKP